MSLVPTLESLLLCEILEQGIGIRTIHFHLLESWKLRTVIHLAELMDRLVGARSLLSKLVAGEIKDFKSLTMIFFVEFLQFLILWCKSTFYGCVDDEQHLRCILLKSDALSFSVFDSKIKNCTHFLLSLYKCTAKIRQIMENTKEYLFIFYTLTKSAIKKECIGYMQLSDTFFQ